MKFGFVDGLLIAVYDTRRPTPVEWDGYLAEVRRGACTVQLVATQGGGPTRSQHRELRRVLDAVAARQDMAGERRVRRPTPRRVPTAILTDLWFTRITLDLFGIFDSAWEVRAFRASALSDALAYLGVLASRKRVVEREIGRLRREERVEARYLELLAPCREAQHCGEAAACALWSEGGGGCTCGCGGCMAAGTRLVQAHDEELARDVEGDPEFGVWLRPRLRKIEAGIRTPPAAKNRALVNGGRDG